MCVTSADVRKYGGSEGCQACSQVYTFGTTNVTHSDACRRRIQELMKGDDVGRARLDASRKRKASSQAFERDAPPMPRVGQESGPDNQLPVQEESTRPEGDDGAEIPAAQGSGDPDQSRMDMSEGAASSSGQGHKGQQVKQDFLKMLMSPTHRVPSEQAWKLQSLEWSQMPGDRELRKELLQQQGTMQILISK